MIVKIPSIKENVAVVESFIENAAEKIKIKESVVMCWCLLLKRLIMLLFMVTKRIKKKRLKLNSKKIKSIRFVVEDEGGGLTIKTFLTQPAQKT